MSRLVCPATRTAQRLCTRGAMGDRRGANRAERPARSAPAQSEPHAPHPITVHEDRRTVETLAVREACARNAGAANRPCR